MASARQSHTATLLPNRKVLVAGGFNGSSTVIATAELYDPATGTWSATAVMASARAVHTATLLQTPDVLVAGGFGTSSVLASAELYSFLVEFSAFTAQLAVYPNQQEFRINCYFTLGASSGGINPLTEPVTLTIDSFTITIPPGSFVNAGGVPEYFFVGVINGVSLSVSLLKLGGNNYAFGVIAKNVSLILPLKQSAITLTIGVDSGSTNVIPVVINT
jgi:hypothetical protein